MAKLRKHLFALTLATLVIAVAGVALAANDKPKGQVVIGMLGDIETLNPLLSENYSETQILNSIFENLLVLDEKGVFHPQLAVEVPSEQNGSISKDGLVYTWKLRKDIKWHDGKPFTAEDVKFTWELIMNQDVPVVTREGYDKITKFEVLDPYTIRMTLKEVYAPFFLNWTGSSPSIVPKHILSKVNPKEITKGGAFSRDPIGTGPFKFKEWKSDSHVALEANKEYWGEGPYLASIVHKVVPDTNTLLTQLKTGEVGIAQIQPPQYDEARKIKHAKVLKTPAATYLHITFNFNNPFLTDKRVRQALTYALPRQLIVQNVLKGIGIVAAHSVAPPSWAHNPNIPAFPYDIKKAQSLLKEAGFKDTDGDGILEKGGKKLSLTISTNSGNRIREQIEQIAQKYWKLIGVDLKIQNYEPATLFGDILENRKFDLIMFGWVSPPDPDSTTLYHSNQIPSAANNNEGQNYAGYKNAEVDKILEDALKTTDVAARKKLYWRMQEIVADELPLMYIYYYIDVDVIPKNLANFKPTGSTIGFSWNSNEWELK